MNDWPHAPIHRFGEGGFYFITAGTMYKQHFFRSAASLDELRATLFAQATKFACWLQAWALFSNAVHHGLVTRAENYRWCSASWFAECAPRSFVETVRRMKIDRLNVYDDFAAALPPQ